MNREEIVQAVQSYIRNENEKYALLINGAWGSGKTFLYENYLCDAISDIEVGKNERKKNVYISLYGISTIETLSKQLMKMNSYGERAVVREWNQFAFMYK